MNPLPRREGAGGGLPVRTYTPGAPPYFVAESPVLPYVPCETIA
jgi:hypothetical protein